MKTQWATWQMKLNNQRNCLGFEVRINTGRWDPPSQEIREGYPNVYNLNVSFEKLHSWLREQDLWCDIFRSSGEYNMSLLAAAGMGG